MAACGVISSPTVGQCINSSRVIMDLVPQNYVARYSAARNKEMNRNRQILGLHRRITVLEYGPSVVCVQVNSKRLRTEWSVKTLIDLNIIQFLCCNAIPS